MKKGLILKEKIQGLPSTPGVYLMKDNLGGILYVGKAKNLKKRVQSYFRDSSDHSPKIKKLVNHLTDFDYIQTDTEFEAFMLECKLIKEIKPHYNRKMKNPQSFVYVVIKQSKGLRRLEISNTYHKNDVYFGPFTSRSTVEKAIQGLKECFQILCGNFSKKGTACLNYSLGLCMGVCLGGPALEKYNSILDKIIALLKGTDKSILSEMTQLMHDASMNFDFEMAAKFRDYINAVTILISKEKVIEFTEENHNIAVIETFHDGSLKLFLLKRTEIVFCEKVEIESIEALEARMKAAILTHFNLNELPSSSELHREEIDEAQIICGYLKSNNCSYILIPDKWLHPKNNGKLEKEINKFLSKKIEPQLIKA